MGFKPFTFCFPFYSANPGGGKKNAKTEIENTDSFQIFLFLPAPKKKV